MMEQTYTILGVKLAFPCKAYPTQLSMMSMIIKGINRHQNCLLESPTGSGKSLALLCSSLGWQAGEREKQKKAAAEAYNKADYIPIDDDYDDKSFRKPCTCSCNKPSTSTTDPGPSTSTATSSTVFQDDEKPSKISPPFESKWKEEESAILISEDEDEKKDGANKKDDDDDDFDFQPSKKRSRNSVGPMGTAKKTKRQKGVVFDDDCEDVVEQSPNPHTKAHWEMKLVTPQAKAGASELSGSKNDTSPCSCSCHISKCQKMMEEEEEKGMKKEGDAPKPIKVPRIYFGTRTHKQIAQIIRELGRTAYKSVRMSILGSREHTCVHPEVSKSKKKNEGCKELLDNKTGGTCKYFTNVHKMKQQWQIRDYGLTEAWDIEDLVNLGKRVKACPYFSSRSLKDQADVIFCPYNYLIDPMIRESMEIDLKGQVVILDEAHNIEDSAREAASLTVTTEQLQDAIDELDKLLSFKFREEHTRVIHSVGSSLLRWINDFSTTLRQNDFDRASRMWTGQEMVAALANMGISPGTLGTLQHHLAALTEDEDERGIKEMGPTLGAATGSLFKALFVIFNFLFKDDMKFTKDYKIALLKTKAKNQFPNTNNRWIQRRRSNQAVWTLSLNFWCLNPAVAFTDFGNSVRTIILTSGTLSPMSSFASELGVAFPIQLEANHVIKSSQVWVGSLAFGPNGHSLNATYKNAETFAFQDDLGRVVLEVCKVIPYGVLCFVSSYSMMNKVIERWTATGLYDQLQSLKSVMCEARGGDKSVFDEQLREFYETIKLCEEDGLENQRITGVLMFAVCRGKISEGMDFADNNARAVITVGIPYPNVRDAQVEAKRHYNDQYAASRGLLSGGEWYEVQAYRALNQALGRCIRHKKDWGAILLIDERFSRNPKKYISGISKWVRGKVNHHSQARDALTSLSEFANLRMQTSPDADTSVFDGSQPNSQTLSPVTPSASSLNTSNLSHTPFRFGHQTSMPGTPECGQTNRMDNTSLPKQEKGMLFGRSNVGQLFIPMSKSAPTPTSNSMNDPTLLQHHIGQQGSMGSFVARGNGQCQTVAEEDQEEQTKGRKTRRERKPKGKRAQEKLDAAQKVPPQQTLRSFSPAVASNANSGVSKQQLGMSLINKTNGAPNVVIMNSGTCQNAQAESTSFIPVQSVQALPSVPIHSGGVIDLTSPVKSLSNEDEVQRTHIPTPKAKLKFDDEPLPKFREEATKTSFTSFKNKLSRFAFTKDENDNGCQKEERNDEKCCRFESSCGNVSNQETLVIGNVEEVQDDHTLKRDQRTTCVPTSDEEEEQCEEDMRRKQREEDNGTPVLFDSEMGDSGSDAPAKPIPFSPQGTKAEPEESKKCTFSTEDISKPNEITNESNNYYAADRTDDTNEMKTERDCDRSSRRLSIKGRRNLSRRKDHGEQNEAKEDANETTVQETKPHMLVRRSARTRRTPKKVIDTVEKSKFCKDDIECVQCGIPLIRNLDGVTCLLPEDVKNKYLSDVMATKDRGQMSSCRCTVKGVEGSIIMTDASNLVHCNSITAENKSRLRLNAFWSSEDACCYQPIVCSVCDDKRKQSPKLSSTPPVIGCSVVAAGPNSSQVVGESYIYPEEVGCCTLLLSQKNK